MNCGITGNIGDAAMAAFFCVLTICITVYAIMKLRSKK